MRIRLARRLLSQPGPSIPSKLTACRHVRHSSSSPSSSAPSSSSFPPTSVDLRNLMRNVAQPVAVITANLHKPGHLDQPDHGATVSSFVSIALSPSPLVAFALRLPSRLATFLNAPPPPPSANTSEKGPSPNFKIHLLSSSQEHLARAFARQPPVQNSGNSFSSSSAAAAAGPPSSKGEHIDLFAPFPQELFAELEHNSLGSLSCLVMGKVHLVDPLPDLLRPIEEEKDMQDIATSQLFVAKVCEVNIPKGAEAERKSLLYSHQKYCKVQLQQTMRREERDQAISKVELVNDVPHSSRSTKVKS